MQVMCAKDTGDTPGERRRFEGFLRGKPKKDAEVTGEGDSGAEVSEARPEASQEQPFGFYRPDPEDEERDRVARRLWKQVFG